MVSFTEMQDNCDPLLEGGLLINNEWKPYGCKLHNYTSHDFKQCLKRRSQGNNNKANLLLFIGDSITRQRFRTIKRLLLDEPLDIVSHLNSEIYEDLETSTQVQFEWRTSTSDVVNFLQSNFTLKPDFIILGVNYWEVVNADIGKESAVSEKHLHLYEEGLYQIASELRYRFDSSDIVWAMAGPVNFTAISNRKNPNSHWLVALEKYRQKFPNGKITPVEMHNNIALNVFENHNIRICKAFHPIGKLFLQNMLHNDGVHVPVQGLAIVQQVLANYLCNSVMHVAATTCCTRKH